VNIGRIFKPRAGVPPDHPWMWTITGAMLMPALPSHGFCATLDEAKARLARTRRGMLGAQVALGQDLVIAIIQREI